MVSFPVIEKLGGRDEVFELLKQAGYPIRTVDAVRMWGARGTIPGDAARLLMEACDQRRIAYQAPDFKAVSEVA